MFSLNSVTKVFVITVKGIEPAISCVRDQDATTVLARHRRQTGSLNWLQFMLQWFIRFPGIAEFRENSINILLSKSKTMDQREINNKRETWFLNSGTYLYLKVTTIYFWSNTCNKPKQQCDRASTEKYQISNFSFTIVICTWTIFVHHFIWNISNIWL